MTLMTKVEAQGEVPFRITDPERIPAQRYYDESFYKAEVEKLWPHVWQMACRLEQIPNVGDWIEYKILGKSVIVMHAAEGIKAYHNACRHRGVPITEGRAHGSCEHEGFTCPFHGWRWNIEGENTFVYGKQKFSEKQLDKADLALKPCRVELWGGCAFINFDDNAPALRASFGPVAERLEAHGLANLRAEWWFATELPANWKIAMEAFMEGYHVMKTHPQLQRVVPGLYNSMYAYNMSETGGVGLPTNPYMSGRENIKAQFRHLELLSEGMAGMVHPKEIEIARGLLDVDLPEDPQLAVQTWFGILQDQISKQLQAKGEKVPDLNAVCVSDPVNAVEFMFPHYFLLPMFTAMSAYRIRPTGPETCIFELWSLAPFAPGEEPPVPMEPTWLPYDSPEFPPIPRQDYSNIPIQQVGVHAEGFEFMRLAQDVEGLVSNYQRLIDGYLGGVAPEKLAQANNLLGGNFDGKIFDLGF
ncbi:aromatic ring-hydroxylating dioxygenase subunit alpha [Acidocella sp.]|uniref:aromatic ring-hydroxylating oxygenase subunit alpha n=1 Tax=Acidocella sp. TaxID=50710 RepID=UPI00261AB1FD|nr:aromatic ring-hydroxylating dioxygenase subunit alpha [Acidocella sp.]